MYIWPGTYITAERSTLREQTKKEREREREREITKGDVEHRQ